MKDSSKVFDIQYTGPKETHKMSRNLPFNVGSPLILWNKIMEEVRVKRNAGPFNEVSFSNFIQSPVGLVPKQQSQKCGAESAASAADPAKATRLIFHLSYPTLDSVNYHTPKEACGVKYKGLDHTIKFCMKQGRGTFMAKSDMKAAFRNFQLGEKIGNGWL